MLHFGHSPRQSEPVEEGEKRRFRLFAGPRSSDKVRPVPFAWRTPDCKYRGKRRARSIGPLCALSPPSSHPSRVTRAVPPRRAGVDDVFPFRSLEKKRMVIGHSAMNLALTERAPTLLRLAPHSFYASKTCLGRLPQSSQRAGLGQSRRLLSVLVACAPPVTRLAGR